MFWWIYDYPSSVIGVIFGLVFVGITWLGIWLFHAVVHSWLHGERGVNDLVGFAFSSFSVLYGLLLGLLAVAAYQNFFAVSDIATREASALTSLYLDTKGFPPAFRDELESDLREYTRLVIDESWPLQRRGIVPRRNIETVMKFRADLVGYEPSNRGEEIMLGETFRQFNAFVEARRARLASVTTGIPAAMWWVVAIGAVLDIGLILLMDMELHVHFILRGALALFLGMVIFLIAVLDNPYRGDVSVGPDAFQEIYDTVMTPERTPSLKGR
jgi:hypothetical protein